MILAVVQAPVDAGTRQTAAPAAATLAPTPLGGPGQDHLKAALGEQQQTREATAMRCQASTLHICPHHQHPMALSYQGQARPLGDLLPCIRVMAASLLRTTHQLAW